MINQKFTDAVYHGELADEFINLDATICLWFSYAM